MAKDMKNEAGFIFSEPGLLYHFWLNVKGVFIINIRLVGRLKKAYYNKEF